MSDVKLHIDPRTKLFLLILCVLCAMNAPSIYYNCGLVIIVAIFGIFLGRVRFVFVGTAAFAAIVVLSLWIMGRESSSMRTTLIAFLGLMHKVFPCGMLSGVLVPTTRISEFLSAMYKMHMPKSIVIPLAVMLRYVPTIQEDWSFIKDAMVMRDVSPSLRGFLSHPIRTMECIYVPMMMAASKASDELTIASVTRGIENPVKRTSIIGIRFSIQDMIVVLVLALYFCSAFLFEWRW